MSVQKNILFRSVFILFCLFLNACNLTPKKSSSSKLSLSTVWVQDSLLKPNFEFRKINRMSPIFYKDRIVVGNAIEGLVAYDIETKNIIWRLPIPQGVETGGPVVKDRLFIGSNNGKVYSIDLINGQIIWIFDTKSEVVAEPLLEEAVLYFISGNQSIFAVDATNGKQLWTYNRQDTANLMTIRGGAKPALSQGFIYAGFSDGSVVSLNAKTGTQQWEITLNKNSRFKDIDASPVIEGDYLYINSYDDQLYCLAKNKGEIVWKSPYGGAGTPIIIADKIFSTSSRGELVSLSKKDGHLFWKNKTTNGIFVDPVNYKGLILTAESQGQLALYDSLTGELKASFEPGRGIFSKPTVDLTKNLIYFISGEGNIYGLQLKNIKTDLVYLKKDFND